MLRRTKSLIAHQLPHKSDQIVFCRMADLQGRAYARMLDSPDFVWLRRASVTEACSCGSGDAYSDCCVRPEQVGASSICYCSPEPHFLKSFKTILFVLAFPVAMQGPIWRYLHPTGQRCTHCPACLTLPCLTVLSQVANHIDLLNPRPDRHGRQATLPPARLELARELRAIALADEDMDSCGGGAGWAWGGVGDHDEIIDKKGMSKGRVPQFREQLDSLRTCGKMRVLQTLLRTALRRRSKVLLFRYKLVSAFSVTVNSSMFVCTA